MLRLTASPPDVSRRHVIHRDVRLENVLIDAAELKPKLVLRCLERSLAPKGRWRFLTSNGPDALAPVLADFGQDAVWIPADGETAAPERLRHVLKVFLVDEHRDIRNVYSTGLLDPRLVMNDLRTVLSEFQTAEPE